MSFEKKINTEVPACKCKAEISSTKKAALWGNFTASLPLVLKTIFLCEYLKSEELRREIHEGLNIVELWNSVNDFIFFGKGGEFATNNLEEQEITMLCLHLLQISLAYVNALMIQQVLSEPEWENQLAPADLRALTPLIYGHINPYGTFNLDLNERIPIEK